MRKIVLASLSLLAAGIVLLFVRYFFVPHDAQLFPTLTDMQAYAKKMDEYPSNEVLAWATPKYNTFWRKQMPSRFDTLVRNLRLRPRSLWSIDGFKKLLDETIRTQESNGYIGRFVLKMKPVAGSAFYIWGDVQGAFHSMVRVLSELKARGIINEHLRIIKPYVYFVFNGELINRGPYSLEVLAVVMRLMERNPGRIFYIRGENEDVGHWKNFNMKDELIIRAGTVSQADIPLGPEVDRFFNTLPLALYLIDKEDEQSIDVVRISFVDRKAPELHEETFADFFKDPYGNEITLFKLGDTLDEFKKKINIRAIIEGEKRSSVYRPSPGLIQLEADKGATAWTQMSSPIESFRHLQDFYFDAFAVLDIEKQLNNWTLTLYNQDVRELLGFQRAAIFNLVTGLREYQKEKLEQTADKFGNLRKQAIVLQDEIVTLQKTCPAAK